MQGIKKFVFYWLPAIIWMTIIFYLSSRQKINVTKEYIYDFLIFKGIHMLEYAILYFLLFRCFNSLSNKKRSLKKQLFFPLIVAISYAMTDEIHQSFVPTREGRLRDVIIDSFGVILMYIYIKNNLNWLKKIL